MNKLIKMVCLLAPLTFACGDKENSADGEASSGESGDDTTGGGGPNSDPDCDIYLECVGKVAPDELPSVQDLYGPNGSCWMDESVEDCADDCRDATDFYLKDNPNALECGGNPLCPGQCCEKGADCNPDFPCCDGSTCFQQGATDCVCTNLPEACTMCTNDCLANMVPPETCAESCKFLCEPDLNYDPIGCRTWPDP